MATKLNPAQFDAVQTLTGPLLVLAGAGTGKTRVVTHRIAELIRNGTPAERILAVTFTNKAAGEMKQRAGELLGKNKRDQLPEISTFHSLCVRILRRHAKRLGYPQRFPIYDRGDQESVARSALREIRATTEMLRPADLLYQIGLWKMASIRPEQAVEVARTDKEHLAASAYRRYQRNMRAVGAMDFDDLLLLTEELFHRFEDVRQAEARRFDHLLIDEYQDTNGSQYRIVKALAQRHRNLCVVGDDDQSIYGWRGAEVSHILRFSRDWPDAKVVRLEDNYRSTDKILHFSNTLIAFNRTRHDKVLRAARTSEHAPRILQLKNEVVEAEEVVREIRFQIENREASAGDFAILFRTNEQPRAFETELRRANVPYVLIGGMSFFDRREVRDVLAYVKLLAQPDDDVALLRVLNTPPRGITTATSRKLQEQAVAGGHAIWRILPEAIRTGNYSRAATEGLRRFGKLISEYRGQIGKQPLVNILRGLIHDIRYQEDLQRLYKEPNDRDARWAVVEEVVNALGSYEQRAKKPTFDDFLAEMILSNREDPQDKERQLDRDAVALMTLHGAKGLEFPRVYMVGMEEGILPHRRAIEVDGDDIDEERRLCYVGVTRAMNRLTLTLSLARQKWGKSRPTIPSRFLFEMTGKADNPQRMAKMAAQSKAAFKGPAGSSKSRTRGTSANSRASSPAEDGGSTASRQSPPASPTPHRSPPRPTQPRPGM
jgi:DNA helicase-2/ATP-dependent DNA helicase PcrA